MVRGQMGVPHRHRQIRVPQSSSKHEDIPAIHHEVRRERVTKYVRQLPFLQLNSGPFRL